ncbi:MAG TPA: OsmC family protein [Candidatus Acidoferrales bacterium]|nr:OsmC family protein [Candidatus Acidoferrales bacterium]
MDAIHKYEIRAKATRVRSGVVASDAIAQPIVFSAPPEFSGEPRVWTPEHFFVASVVTCFVSTFSGMADLSKFSFNSLEVDAEGTLERDATGWKFTEIKLRPMLKISQEKDSERGARLLEKAERACLIARSITARIVLEPTIKVVPEMVLSETFV